MRAATGYIGGVRGKIRIRYVRKASIWGKEAEGEKKELEIYCRGSLGRGQQIVPARG